MKKEMKKKQVKITRESKTKNIPHESYIAFLIIMAFAFILYGNTILHDYALDDSYVITENDYTQKGIGGIGDIFTKDFFSGRYDKYGKNENIVTGGRYRPLSVVTFAIEYQFFKKSPHISHLINILLYGFTCIILYRVLQKLFRKYTGGQKWYLSFSFIATILFISHPLHTEVVANIKGRDEIMSLLGSLLTLLTVLKFLESEKLKYLVYSFIFFFLGLLSKENTITFLAVVPLSVYFFTSVTIKKNLSAIIPAVIAALLFLGIRQSVLGSNTGEVEKELMNNPFLNTGFADKYATIFYTLGLYIKLLIFPHPLTFDYYPYHIPIITWADLRAIIPLIVNIALFVYAVFGMKKKNPVSYSLWLYFATLSIASNLLFPIGVFMNERFVFASSIGYCIILAYVTTVKLPVIIKDKNLFRIILASFVGVILILYSVKTISRNLAWKDNKTLFSTDVVTSSNSVKSNSGLGELLYHEGEKVTDIKARKEILKQSIKYLDKAVSIHPDYVNALILLANAYFEYNRNTDTTLMYYMRILRVSPKFQDVYTNLPVVVKTIPEIDKRIKFYEEVYSINEDRPDVCYELGLLYGKDRKDYQKAIFYLERSVSLNTSNSDVFNSLGMAYGMSGNLKKALENFQKADALKPNDKQIMTGLGITLQQLGELQKAKYYFDKVNSMY